MPFAESLDIAPFQMFGPGTGTGTEAFQGFRDEWWDPALRAQMVVAEFGGTKWRGVKLPGPDNSEANLQVQVQSLLALRRRARGRRQAEILAQAADFVAYFHKLLGTGDRRRPATAGLVEAGVAVGHMVGMYWKNEWKRMRPAQVYPALMTLVPTPGHPSYPSNHALQSWLAYLCVVKGLEKGGVGEGVCGAVDEMLRPLALRIGENREVAGVHFNDDSRAGRYLAGQLIGKVTALKAFKALSDGVKAEWSGVVSMAAPLPPLPVED